MSLEPFASGLGREAPGYPCRVACWLLRLAAVATAATGAGWAVAQTASPGNVAVQLGALLREPQGFVVFPAGPEAATHDLLIARADGNDVNVLVPGDAATSHVDPAWSPNGSEVVFVTRVKGVSRGVSIVRRAGAKVRGLTNADDVAPTWSPNGRWIAFLRNTASAQAVYVVAPDGSQLHAVASGGSYGRPRWSGDSRQLLLGFVATPGGCPRIGLIRLGSPIAIVGRHLCASSPSWSRAANVIAFTGDSRIGVIQTDGRHMRLLKPTVDGAPVLAPDAKRLAFPHPVGTPNVGDALMTIRVDGTGLRRITDGVGERDDPVQWSADGRWLLAARANSIEDLNGSDLMIFRADGSGRRLIAANVGASNAAWWPASPLRK
jgi:Tol biopolymer transport system component